MFLEEHQRFCSLTASGTHVEMIVLSPSSKLFKNFDSSASTLPPTPRETRSYSSSHQINPVSGEKLVQIESVSKTGSHQNTITSGLQVSHRLLTNRTDWVLVLAEKHEQQANQTRAENQHGRHHGDEAGLDLETGWEQSVCDGGWGSTCFY
ncbi:hypothetical protein XENORESO_016656 [Xenotaenia resolanae]|uniref:Uncharacterized protein n=1 Tax=Xenotaenia resolanae TaxID=208358 RepID=A0ABV0XAG5_9TELE